MRPVLGFAAAFGLAIVLTVGGPAAAAVSVKANAPPDRLGGCAIALTRWNAITEAQGNQPQAEYVERLNAIMAQSHARADADPWNQALTTAMLAQIKLYDAMTGDAQVKAMQRDLFGCESFFDAQTRPPEPTYAGPFLAGPGYKVTLATPPSYAGYCYLAFASVRNFEAAKGVSDPEVDGALSGFTAIIGGMGEGYRNVATESANNRNVFYTNYRASSGEAAFLTLLQDDVKDCARFIVAR